MGICSIDDLKEHQLQVIWDLGRRCTYSCSYCPPHRKNNWSDTASYEELVSTATNLERYSEVYNSKRNERFDVALSFTGGEPTVNPDLFDFLEYLRDTYPNWKRTLTTNGFYSERRLHRVMQSTNYTTVSYHCESSKEQKRQVRNNIETMLGVGYNFKINIMFHAHEEYFNECIDLAHWCDDNKVKYTPRVIGDESNIKEGLKTKSAHTYTKYQLDWMKNYWKAKGKQEKPAYYASNPPVAPTGVMAMLTPKREVGQKIGRPCCGGRNLHMGFDDGKIQEGTFVENNNFQGWSCMVNWYFLYIHQEIDKIWHHQTCQVNMDGEVGPICNVSNFDKYIDNLEVQFDKGVIPFIRCPKTYCGCGLCVPKARVDDVAKNIFNAHAPNIQPKFMKQKEDLRAAGLKSLVIEFDKENGNETI
jgi:MoaA/NifB/PqqE/SkfB family radical SAM enzyme